MPASSHILRSLDAVAAAIDTIGYPAAVSFVPRYELADAEEQKVDVYPGALFGDPSVTIERTARGRVHYGQTVVVCVRQRLARTGSGDIDPEAVDACSAVVEAIAHGLRNEQLNAGPVSVREVDITVLFFSGDLDESGLFNSAITCRALVEVAE